MDLTFVFQYLTMAKSPSCTLCGVLQIIPCQLLGHTVLMRCAAHSEYCDENNTLKGNDTCQSAIQMNTRPIKHCRRFSGLLLFLLFILSPVNSTHRAVRLQHVKKRKYDSSIGSSPFIATMQSYYISQFTDNYVAMSQFHIYL